MIASLVVAVVAILLLSILWIYKKITEVSRALLHLSRFLHLVVCSIACIGSSYFLHILPPCAIQGRHNLVVFVLYLNAAIKTN